MKQLLIQCCCERRTAIHDDWEVLKVIDGRNGIGLALELRRCESPIYDTLAATQFYMMKGNTHS